MALWLDSPCQEVWLQALKATEKWYKLNISGRYILLLLYVSTLNWGHKHTSSINLQLIFLVSNDIYLTVDGRCKMHLYNIVSKCVTFNGAVEDVSPACIVHRPSTCPGEAYQPGHSIWPFLETTDHLFHPDLNITCEEIKGWFRSAWTVGQWGISLFNNRVYTV